MNGAARARSWARDGSPWTDSSQWTTCSRSGCAAASSRSCAGEHDGVLVLVRVHQDDLTGADRQRRLQDGQHRRDARPAGEQQQVGVEGLRREHPGGLEGFDPVADREPVVDPVRRDARRRPASPRSASARPGTASCTANSSARQSPDGVGTFSVRNWPGAYDQSGRPARSSTRRRSRARSRGR